MFKLSSLIRIKIKSQLFEALRNLIYFLLYTSSNADEDEGIGDDNDEDDDDDDDDDARSSLTRFACCYPPPHTHTPHSTLTLSPIF